MHVTRGSLFPTNELSKLGTYRRVLLIGGTGTGKTTKLKEITRIVRSDPNNKVLVITPTDEFRDIAESLNLEYVEPEWLGLDPIAMYRDGIISRDDLEYFLMKYIGKNDLSIYVRTMADVDSYGRRVYEGDMIKLKGNMVLSLSKFYGNSLEKAGFLIPALLLHKIYFEPDMNVNFAIVVDNAELFLDPVMWSRLMMEMKGKMMFVSSTNSLWHLEGRQAIDILSSAQLLYIFRDNKPTDHELLRQILYPDDEDYINEITVLPAGESIVVDRTR